ncbi:FAD-linked sulfhydryl oxidase-like protein ERV2 [Phycomyces blakesleeanus]
MRAITFASIIGCFILLTGSFYVLYERQQSVNISLPMDLAASEDAAKGGVIMSHLGNATIKAELGRSTWKLLHTMVARFPESPTSDERAALKQFILLLSRLYPCGECAEHFQKLLAKYPPQTSSRVAASQWACAIHNHVNQRLGKEIFNCADIEAKYQCGCDAENTETTL